MNITQDRMTQKVNISNNDTYNSTRFLTRMAERFLAIRNHFGKTQQEFADDLSISLRTEQNYERGDRKISSEVLLELHEQYQVDPLWLLNGAGSTPQKRMQAKDLDMDLLEKAIAMVELAIADSGKSVSKKDYARYIREAYRYYTSEDKDRQAASLLAAAMKEA